MSLQALKDQLKQTVEANTALDSKLETLAAADSYAAVIDYLITLEQDIFKQINMLLNGLDKTQSIADLYAANNPALKTIEALDKTVSLLTVIASEHETDILTEMQETQPQRYAEIMQIKNNIDIFDNYDLTNYPGYRKGIDSIKQVLVFSYLKGYQMGELSGEFAASIATHLATTCPQPPAGEYGVGPKFGIDLNFTTRAQSMACARAGDPSVSHYVPDPRQQKSVTPEIKDAHQAYMQTLPEGLNLSAQSYANVVDIDCGREYAAPIKFKVTTMVDVGGGLFGFVPSGASAEEVDAFYKNQKKAKDTYLQENTRIVASQMLSGMVVVFNDGRLSYMSGHVMLMHESTHGLHQFSGTVRSGFTEDDTGEAEEFFDNLRWAGGSAAPVEEQHTTNNFISAIPEDRFSERSLAMDAGFLLENEYVGRQCYSDDRGKFMVCELQFMEANQLKNPELRQPLNSAAGPQEEVSPQYDAGCLELLTSSVTSCFTRGNRP